MRFPVRIAILFDFRILFYPTHDGWRPGHAATAPSKLPDAELFVCPQQFWRWAEGKPEECDAKPPTAPEIRANASADYVFVDEHNRHKRLKGKLLAPGASAPVLMMCSDESVRGVSKEEDQV